jgi:hypothetical protein
VNVNQSCGIDAFLIKSCPPVVQALYLLSLKLTSSAYQTDDLYIDLTRFVLENVFSQR